MSPIRVAIIGLSSSAKTSWAADAHLPYLLSSRGKTHYTIAALLNSSVQAAEAAKEHFSLPNHTKAYGDPAALAADPDIDLVIVNTRVDTHFITAEPSVRAGKALYVEWPIAESYERAIQLQNSRPNTSQGNGTYAWPNSIAGIQGRVSPVVLTLKPLLASGRIGPVLSSSVRAYGNLLSSKSLPDGLAYFADRKVGGNPITIAFGHMIDYVHEVIGNWADEGKDFHSRLQIQRPKIGILNSEGKEINVATSDVPDFLTAHGRLTEQKGQGKVQVEKGATLAVTYRSGQPFKGQPAFEWIINGAKGELRLTSPSGPYLMSGDSYGEPFVVEVHDHETDSVEIIPWDWKDWQKELPIRARATGEVYERYARWIESGKPEGKLGEGDEWPRISDAIGLHEELEQIWRQYDSQSA